MQLFDTTGCYQRDKQTDRVTDRPDEPVGQPIAASFNSAVYEQLCVPKPVVAVQAKLCCGFRKFPIFIEATMTFY